MPTTDIGLRAKIAPEVDEQEAEREADQLAGTLREKISGITPDLSSGPVREGVGRSVGGMIGKSLPGRLGTMAGGVIGEKIAGTTTDEDTQRETREQTQNQNQLVDLAVQRNEMLESMEEAFDEEGLITGEGEGDGGGGLFSTIRDLFAIGGATSLLRGGGAATGGGLLSRILGFRGFGLAGLAGTALTMPDMLGGGGWRERYGDDIRANRGEPGPFSEWLLNAGEKFFNILGSQPPDQGRFGRGYSMDLGGGGERPSWLPSFEGAVETLINDTPTWLDRFLNPGREQGIPPREPPADPTLEQAPEGAQRAVEKLRDQHPNFEPENYPAPTEPGDPGSRDPTLSQAQEGTQRAVEALQDKAGNRATDRQNQQPRVDVTNEYHLDEGEVQRQLEQLNQEAVRRAVEEIRKKFNANSQGGPVFPG